MNETNIHCWNHNPKKITKFSVIRELAELCSVKVLDISKMDLKDLVQIANNPQPIELGGCSKQELQDKIIEVYPTCTSVRKLTKPEMRQLIRALNNV